MDCHVYDAYKYIQNIYKMITEISGRTLNILLYVHTYIHMVQYTKDGICLKIFHLHGNT